MLRILWRRWLDLAHKIGNFQARIVLTVFYFLILTPFGLLVRLFSDPLHCKSGPGTTGWLPRETRDVDLDAARRQA